MRKLLTLLLFLPIPVIGQSFDHFVYADFSADPNKIFGVIDNPHTEVDHRGLDFDLEAGVVVDKIGAYIFYGRFENADYQNYGAGLDYHFLGRSRVDLAVGAGLSRIVRKLPAGAYYEREEWADVGSIANYHIRTTAVFWILEDLGLSGRFQYQKRDDVEVHGVFEGAVGIRYKLDRR